MRNRGNEACERRWLQHYSLLCSKVAYKCSETKALMMGGETVERMKEGRYKISIAAKEWSSRSTGHEHRIFIVVVVVDSPLALLLLHSGRKRRLMM